MPLNLSHVLAYQVPITICCNISSNPLFSLQRLAFKPYFTPRQNDIEKQYGP